LVPLYSCFFVDVVFEQDLKIQMNHSALASSAFNREEEWFEDCGDCDICREMIQKRGFSQHGCYDPDSSDDEFFLAPEDDLGREMRLVDVIKSTAARK
jgi:hypothetical protein